MSANVLTFTVDAYGAQGAAGCGNNGGFGGYISVTNISASPFIGQTLYVYVGGQGGYNGGGGGAGCGANGGGGTDIRTSSSSLTSRYALPRTYSQLLSFTHKHTYALNLTHLKLI